MNFRSRPHIENRQMVQYPGEGITLSGQTTFDLGNYDGYIYDSHLDFVNGISGSTYITLPYSASTDPVSGWTEHTVFKPGYFRVIPARKITFSGNTDVVESVYQPDVTSYVLGSLDSQGTVGWMAMSAATVTPYIFDTSVVSDAIIPLVGTNVSQSTKSSILGGINNTINTNSEYSTILGGSGNTVSHQNSHIIGSNITSDSSGTTFVNNLTIRGGSIIQSTNLNSDTLRSLNSFGILTHSDSEDNVIQALINTTYSGSSIFFLGNHPSTESQGTISFYNTGYTRPVPSVTGVDFYRKKMVIKTGGSEGMVINPSSMNDTKTLWFEFNGISRTQLHSSDGYFGLALNPDGSEHPTSNLQIGGTGTTGTFKYRDGNQQSGYVLTSDNDGNATWLPVTASFTGNTSGNCITDLYVSNVYGCSPVTFHDTVIGIDLEMSNNIVAGGSVSATTYYGDGSNLSGIITTTTATTQNILVGENVVYGDLLYLTPNGTYLKTSNTSESTSSTELRISLESIVSNNSGLSLVSGLFITSGLTSGTTYWVGSSGNMTNIQPTGDGEIVRSVGTSINETFFNFNPSTVWIELSNVTNPTITTQPSYKLTTISYSLTDTDWTVNVNTTGDTTQTLPLSTQINKGKVFNIKNSDTTETSIVTISTTSSQLIDGLYGNGIDLTILYPQSITVQSTGDGYIII